MSGSKWSNGVEPEPMSMYIFSGLCSLDEEWNAGIEKVYDASVRVYASDAIDAIDKFSRSLILWHGNLQRYDSATGETELVFRDANLEDFETL